MGHTPLIMVVWPFDVLYRRCIIGIKASLIEFERMDGRGGLTQRLRVAQRSEHNGVVNAPNDTERAGLGGSDVGNGKVAQEWGSDAIGLSECEMLGFTSQLTGECDYSRYVCAGFSARIERVGRGRNPKSIASATP